jgi:hypothetical protein
METQTGGRTRQDVCRVDIDCRSSHCCGRCFLAERGDCAVSSLGGTVERDKAPSQWCAVTGPVVVFLYERTWAGRGWWLLLQAWLGFDEMVRCR